MRVLLEAMEIRVDDKKFKKLINSIDLNGNGIIEFDEFCYMMYCILGNDKSKSMWKGLVPTGGKPTNILPLEGQGSKDIPSISVNHSGEHESVRKVDEHAAVFAVLSDAATKVKDKIDEEDSSSVSSNRSDRSSSRNSITSKKSQQSVNKTLLEMVVVGTSKAAADAAEATMGLLKSISGALTKAEAKVMQEFDHFHHKAMLGNDKHNHGPFCFCGCRKILR